MSEDDRTLHGVIVSWWVTVETALESLREGRGSLLNGRELQQLQAQTGYLSGALATNCPRLEPAPMMEAVEVIAAAQRGASPPDSELLVVLEQRCLWLAQSLLNVVSARIQSRHPESRKSQRPAPKRERPISFEERETVLKVLKDRGRNLPTASVAAALKSKGHGMNRQRLLKVLRSLEKAGGD